MQATISVLRLVKNMSINLKSVQKVKLSAKRWNWKRLAAPTLSSGKQRAGQKLNEDWNSLSKFQYNFLNTRQSAKLNNNY